jgi:NAD(P)-dependent dehydrogenase (short-subunit alcohol dehydrogenase family)
MAMSFRLDVTGRLAVVTGASRGIGAACARALAHGGARVVLTARSKDAIEALAAELPNDPVAIRSDLAERDAAGQLADAILGISDKVDILVNNAGIERNESAARISAQAIDEVLTVNLRNLILLTSFLAKPLLRAHGSVINVSSVAAAGGTATQAVYAATKGGVDSLTKNLAREWGPKGVRVNAVAPGLIDTEMWESTFELLGEDSVREGFARGVPLGRWGTADEVAAAVCWLASDASSYVTGQVIRVDGGMS